MGLPSLVAHEEVESLRQDLRILPPKARKVLELRFGLREHRRRTQREIARDLGHVPAHSPPYRRS